MWRQIWCFVVFVGLIRCEIFDLGDVDDQLAQIWHQSKLQPQKLLSRGTSECKANTKSGVKYGECIPYSKCLLTGGSINGICGLLSTCCIIENSCGKDSDAKVGYFEAADLQNGVVTCNYNVKLRTPNICQIRLDFVGFNLAPSTLTLQQNAVNPVYKCIDDRLRIIPNYYGIPELCGNNDKQHVYIHVNQTDGVTKGVQLQMLLADRNYNPQLFAPSWKIKVSQLECPGPKKTFSLPSTDADQDFPMLAPLGAIQYYTDRAGYFKSFAFDGSNVIQSYTYDQKYAMAFKKEIGTCGIKFSPDYFYLPFSQSTGVLVDSLCQHYLFVPELYFDQQMSNMSLVSKVCMKQPLVFRSYAPGPLYLHFNSPSKDFTTDPNVQQGFNIKYELLTKCP